RKHHPAEWRLLTNHNIIAVDDRNCFPFRPHAARLDALANAASSLAAVASTQAQITSTMASFERRKEEWGFQETLASKEQDIADDQKTLALDRYNITDQQRRIAGINADNASAGVTFLRNKFTNAELYQWMSGIVGSAYRYFLQEATTIAKA